MQDIGFVFKLLDAGYWMLDGSYWLRIMITIKILFCKV